MAITMIDRDELERICLLSEFEFVSDEFGDNLLENDLLMFQDRGSDVLGIAHLDSVQSTKHFFIVDGAKFEKGAEQGDAREYVFNGQLDDRMGAYIISKLLPQIGINVDVLLTTDEEIGRSTAQYFEPYKKYNWMFSFDREGLDVVMYDYEGNNEMVSDLESVGFDIGYGSFSDICFLEHLGISGFNVGTGLEDGHSELAGLFLDDAEMMIRRFIEFYNRFRETAYEYIPYRARWSNNVWGTHYGKRTNWGDDWYRYRSQGERESGYVVYGPGGEIINSSYEEAVDDSDDFMICEWCEMLIRTSDAEITRDDTVLCPGCHDTWKEIMGEDDNTKTKKGGNKMVECCSCLSHIPAKQALRPDSLHYNGWWCLDCARQAHWLFPYLPR